MDLDGRLGLENGARLGFQTGLFDMPGNDSGFVHACGEEEPRSVLSCVDRIDDFAAFDNPGAFACLL